tara:strand:+ start:972 stop:1286 length:315 start_codon:yes stop_codon:yes gene_type:complete
MKVPAIFKNKWVVYAIYALAVLNVLGYVSTKSWECLALFAASAYSVNCYAKNIVIAVLAGLFVSNFVFGCGRVRENFEGMDVKKAMETLKKESEKKEKEDDKDE